MKKLLFIPLLLSITNLALSGPYIMSKHELKMKDTNYDKTINHIRFGNSWKTESGLKLYGELGIVEEVKHGSDIFDGTAGTSYQFGFKKKITDNFSWKGKWEGTELHDSSNSHKIEIKTKWKF
tara:strand:- start:134 stop:502 length:369 start_codon:yes stop_codon:yes gene_type:complete